MEIDRGSSDAVQLSRREREVADLVVEGLKNREIGGRLFISERTVDGHLERIREKLGVGNRAQVAAWVVAHRQPAAPAAPRPRAALAPRRAALLGAAMVVVLATAAWSALIAGSSPLIETFAGNGTPAGSFTGAYAGDHQPAVFAKLNHPDSVATYHGSVYIADRGNYVVRRVGPDGVITTVAGGGTLYPRSGVNATSSNLLEIANIALAGDGTLYVTTFAAKVFAVGPDHALREIAPPSPKPQLWTPIGLAADPLTGDLYLTSMLGHSVWRLSNGALSRFAGTGTAGFAGDGLAAISAQFTEPTGLAFDRAGNLFVADTGNNRVSRIDRATGIITTIAGSDSIYGYSGDGGPGTRARLALPMGLAVDAAGDLFIADTENNRVRRVDRQGVITTIAGTGTAGFGGDGGPAIDAHLWGPNALAVSGADLLVSDSANNRVRRIRAVVA
ncbi:MAG TPA: LuxR C-terminal-related transcriptional regulator [Candidatus Dormibacteraeota bacterium]